MDLPKILLTGLFFLFFLVFPEFLDIWKAENGKKGKKQNVQKPNAPSVGFCKKNKFSLGVSFSYFLGIFPRNYSSLGNSYWLSKQENFSFQASVPEPCFYQIECFGRKMWKRIDFEVAAMLVLEKICCDVLFNK